MESIETRMQAIYDAQRSARGRYLAAEGVAVAVSVNLDEVAQVPQETQEAA